MTPRYITAQAAAQYLSVSQRTIHRLAAKGLLPSHKIGKRITRYLQCGADND